MKGECVMEKLLKRPEESAKIDDIKEIRKILLNTLLYIKDICEENSIRYYLCYGTLLGAVRHHGFIPWDDDIDILMSRDDYGKFLSVSSKTSDHYMVLGPLKKGYYYSFAKVVDTNTALYEHGCKEIENMGCFVDIFILDKIPGDYQNVMRKVRKLLNYKAKINYYAYSFPHIRKNLVQYAINAYNYFYSQHHDLVALQKKYIDEISKYKNETAEYIYATGAAYKYKSIYRKEWFDKEVPVEFEGHVFPAPVGYEEILRQLYGDYMQLPPVEKRVSRHDYDAYYIRND